MQFDDVAVRIANEEEMSPVGKIYGLSYLNIFVGQMFLHGIAIGDFERYMRKAGVSFGHVRENVLLRRIRRGVENKVDVNSGRVLHDRDRFRPDRADDKLKAEFLVERASGLQATNPESDMVDSSDRLQWFTPSISSPRISPMFARDCRSI